MTGGAAIRDLVLCYQSFYVINIIRAGKSKKYAFSLSAFCYNTLNVISNELARTQRDYITLHYITLHYIKYLLYLQCYTAILLHKKQYRINISNNKYSIWKSAYSMFRGFLKNLNFFLLSFKGQKNGQL